MDSNSPYLSVVACSRNDDHGGNLRHRMQVFVNGFIEQCRRHQLSAELILVEWNPPADRPRLKEALSWPVNGGSCAVRIIEVSPQVHSRFKYSDRLPLFQMIAKNAGIRRARGRFVLATNIDILFSDEVIWFMKSRLRKKRLYRIDRHDVPSDIPSEVSIDQQLEYCKKHLYRVHRRDATVNLITGYVHQVLPVRSFWAGIREDIRAQLNPPDMRRARIHTNASGDFTLMAKEHWFSLRGYPELKVGAIHLDSLLCYSAHHGPARQLILKDPMRIYHMEHGRSSGDSNTNSTPWESLQNVSETAPTVESTRSFPVMNDDQVETLAIQMRRERRPIIFNDENWGLGQEELPETLIYSKGEIDE